MWRDPIVEEVRKVRARHAAKFKYNLKAIVNDIRKFKEAVPQSGASRKRVRPSRVRRISVSK